MTNTNWYSDHELQNQLQSSIFPKFKSVVKALLVKETKEQDSNRQSLMRDLGFAATDLSALYRDRSDYEACKADTQMYENVDYGTTQITLREAIDRTASDITLTELRIKHLQDQVNALPAEAELRAHMLGSLGN